MNMVSRKRYVPGLATAVASCLLLGACTDSGTNVAGMGLGGHRPDNDSVNSHPAHTDASGKAQKGSAGSDGALTPRTPASPQPEHSAPAGLTALGDTNGAPKTERLEAPAQLAVTDIRIAGHDDFDRVVFEMAGNGMPGWYVSYTEQPFYQGSGRTVDMEHLVALNINIDGVVRSDEVAKDLPSPDYAEVAKLESDLGKQLGVVKEFIPGGMHDGRAQYFLGLDMKQPFSVQVLRGPTRLVIDILH
ncbi:hypothetical protein PQG65_06150 [Corynebacterium pseudodiphtheriticum]|uniref:AMIN-like domain-containing (lipo)protein n=1 Tax=Corynebacterium pseudodiphtheriticum TaxID=37637 RepID=UPI00234D4250|nr:hypothetical protein [Corynebacterium pseudodiphtheriticum]MDC7110953.1 hypothetical protein [Corynebacterium pseudodiphtheriticum]MDC7114909.1 hypothetical protein [Corynebacterium pseudodiphtheriticum]